MTILCATDFSDAAREAASIAVAIADHWHDRLLLVHVVRPQASDPVADFSEAVRASCDRRLRAEAERLQPDGLVIETRSAAGNPEEEIAALAPPDTRMIVVGAHGHRRGTHWLIGTVPERLARMAPLPMLVVRNAAPLRAWLAGTKPLEVNVATDLTPVSDQALDRAAMLRDLGPCNVELTYIDYPPADYAMLGIGGPIHRRHLHADVEDAIEQELLDRIPRASLGSTVRTRIALTIGGIGARIAEVAAEDRADLVVFGAYQRTGLARIWHESIAHAVLHLAQTNLFCVPFRD